MPSNVPPQLPRYTSYPTQPNPSSPDAILQKKADLELAEARKAERAARSYDSFLNAEVDDDDDDEAAKPTYSSVREMEEDFM